MNNNFDDLFNEFFGDNKKNNKGENNNDENIEQDKSDSIDNFINMLNKFDSDSKQSLGEFLDKELGPPDQIEYFDDEDFFFEKRIWFTPHGKIVKIRMIEQPETPEEFYNHGLNKHLGIEVNQETEESLEDYLLNSLEEELDIAIQKENFEEAARIRDLINRRK